MGPLVPVILSAAKDLVSFLNPRFAKADSSSLHPPNDIGANFHRLLTTLPSDYSCHLSWTRRAYRAILGLDAEAGSQIACAQCAG